LLLVGLVAFTAAATFKPRAAWHWSALAVAVVSMPSLLWLAANQASISLQGELPIARASLGSAFWSVLTLLGFIVSSALQQLRVTKLQAVAVSAALLLAFGALLASGACHDLSLMKEYANRADDFAQTVARHVQIVLLALACTLAIGLPLGWAAHAHAKASRALLPVLNIIQTIPSIALFGLLMAPLALLAASVPALGRAGISGVGLAPAVIALTLYGLLPVVRGTLAGLQQVPRAMVQAARALGLTRFQILISVELPLALPVLLGGVRTAAVSSVGLAAVTALIGAGGLGSILFEGLFANAQDVVLLGVLPIIVLGVVIDALFNVLMSLARQRVKPW
jgi:osmoprotectant transport system permease protein